MEPASTLMLRHSLDSLKPTGEAVIIAIGRKASACRVEPAFLDDFGDEADRKRAFGADEAAGEDQLGRDGDRRRGAAESRKCRMSQPPRPSLMKAQFIRADLVGDTNIGRQRPAGQSRRPAPPRPEPVR